MKHPAQQIFRPDAVQRHAQIKDQASLPLFVAPHRSALRWLLFGLLLIGAGFLWFAQLPVYVPGSAVIADLGTAGEATSRPAVVAFLPPEQLKRVKVGQPLFLQLREADQYVQVSIIAVEPTPLSPDHIRERFAGARSHLGVAHPAAVVFASLPPASADPDSGQIDAAAYLGSTGQVQVQTGSRRLISLVPLVGRLLGE